ARIKENRNESWVKLEVMKKVHF
ncbi:MAG: hypothetical protein K0R05_1480, partial [Anaerocolumna sp.]|nr:hypothetical protein [Anaerocolumna sp.]